jgi:beta-N-acetylhexosaminidase
MRQDLSLEEKVGQLMMFGFPGQQITEHIRDFISNHHLGGIIHFARNIDHPEQIQTLNHDLQTLAKNSPNGTGLFIAVDQEGGSVARLTEGVSVSPGNMALGAAGSLELAEEVGRVTGEELRILGFNINLAPCVDVNNNPANPVIGVRSFGSDPERVAQLGAASIKGLQEHVIAVAKHFPGHGDTHVDSHLGLPVIDYDWERLNAVELVPFRAAIQAGVEGMLAAHIFFPAFESNPNRPASLSYGVLTKLLREELGFHGLIMTDCMEMQAITKHFSMAEAAVLTVEAGSDLVLISHTPTLQKEAYWAVVDAVKSGRISEERIDESVTRILAAKERFQVGTPYPGSVGTEANLKVMENAAGESITVVKDQGNLPLDSAERVLVIETKTQAASIAEEKISGTASLGGALIEEGLAVHQYEVGLECTEEEIKKLVNMSTNYSFVIIVTQDAHRYPSQAQCVRELAEAAKVIVVGARTPYELQSFPEVETYVAAYSNRPFVWKRVAPILTGKQRATGELPVLLA